MPDYLHLTSSDADRCVTLSQGDFYLATFTFFTTQAGGMLNWVKRKTLITSHDVGQIRNFDPRSPKNGFLLLKVARLWFIGWKKAPWIRTLSSKAHILAKKWGNVPVILAGDYNSTPQSAIYEFLSSSQLNIMLHDRKELSGQRSCNPAQVFGIERETRNPLHLMDRFFKSGWTDEEVKVATGRAKSEVVMHPLMLNSSYATLKVLNLYTLPIDVLQKTGGLPCQKLGSDHLALVSEFAFMPTEKTL
ncbi:hypothetical protein RHGRI_023871 [Rhododendron griersonianum]|uniref:Endonuclease/exonuclease/phosphatase domain-containing protein n=1 Tax=Rhododendron griersonianum TaxID=479676 RepID=A0AAV6J5F7_9ERIC|nr:hypothetical protein RHGRI_023871 [Rhododendron griersonianum]